MKPLSQRALLAVGILWIGGLGAAGCGASKQRIAVLEQQVAELRAAQQKEAQAEQGEGDAIGPLQEQLNALQESIIASIPKIEKAIGALQAQIARDSTAQGSSQGDRAAWVLAADLLGVDPAGLQSDGNNGYTIKRTWLVEQLRSAAAARQSVRLITAKRGGILVRGVRPRSLAAALGLRNRDLIVAVGEQPVKSSAELYQALRDASSPVSVTVQRRKQKVDLVYTLIDE